MWLYLEKYISLIQFILLFTNFRVKAHPPHPYSSITGLKDCMLLVKLGNTEIRDLVKDVTLPLVVK